MSVIIRLQNLPWSANALDIRRFFTGLSIPEGGVHIVGGEMGDAFIAFSTDEDARQAMMRDRDKINEVQIRLLLSSRAEMQKVIETARQHSVTNVVAQNPQKPLAASSAIGGASLNPLAHTQSPSFLDYQKQAGIMLSEILDSPEKNSDSSDRRRSTSRERQRRSLSRERRRSRSNDRSVGSGSGSVSGRRHRRDRSRSRSRERDYRDWRYRDSRSRRSRTNSNDSRERSGSNERAAYSNIHDNKDKDNRDSNANRALMTGGETSIYNTPTKSPWQIPHNAYQTTTGYVSTESITSGQNLGNPYLVGSSGGGGEGGGGGVASMPFAGNAYSTGKISISPSSSALSTASAFPSIANAAVLLGTAQTLQPINNNNNNNNALAMNNYSTSMGGFMSSSTSTANNNSNNTVFNVNTPPPSGVSPLIGVGYPGIYMGHPMTSDAKQSNVNSAIGHNNGQMQGGGAGGGGGIGGEPIAFAKTNPYAQMYPSLFAQANSTSGDNFSKSLNPITKLTDSCCIKISNMCQSTTYSDLRKFFSGLFIPHNGIKLLNDKYGSRVGVAYIQFSRPSSVQKSLTRNNVVLKSMPIHIEVVSEREFESIEDSFRPMNRSDRSERSAHGIRKGGDSDGGDTGDIGDGDGGGGGGGGGVGGGARENLSVVMDSRRSASEKSNESFSVLFLEELPGNTTEQDILKMFSCYTVYDILLTSSPGNRREFIAYVKFTRENEAKAAFDDKSTHLIGHRKVRVRPGSLDDMEKTKERLRLANEQLLKEEEQQAIADAGNQKNERFGRTTDRQHSVSDDDGDDVGGDNDEDDGDNERNESFNLGKNKNFNPFNRDPRQSNIPSIFDDVMMTPKPNEMRSPVATATAAAAAAAPAAAASSVSSDKISDPRTRRKRVSRFDNQDDNNPSRHHGYQQHSSYTKPNTSSNFIIMKNCDYGATIKDIGGHLAKSNLNIVHIEPLNNDRNMPKGEFIVEFRDNRNAEIAMADYNNTQFMKRTLRMRFITPQEIANRIGKPFMNRLPNFVDSKKMGSENHRKFGSNYGGGEGGGVRRGGGGKSSISVEDSFNSNSQRGGGGGGGDSLNDSVPNPDDRNDDVNRDRASINSPMNGIPEKFYRPGCVVAMENVPFKADMHDIIEFFSGFKLTPGDIIRRFTDEGAPTGDARVAFASPSMARAALDAKKKKTIFNRTIYLSIL